MATLERAIALAASAHSGQVDKAGEPYILHPLRVLMRVTGNDERIAAVLHDVIEDSQIMLADLRAEGFSSAVIAAVDALTKRPGETRIDAARRAMLNPTARVVKLADNADNLDPTRISNPTSRDIARMEEYLAIRRVLLDGL